MKRTMILAAAMGAFAAGCAGDGDAESRGGWMMAVDTVGDTVVMRTSGGSDSESIHTLVAEVAVGDSGTGTGSVPDCYRPPRSDLHRLDRDQGLM